MKLSPVVGRYLTLEVAGAEHRVYFEENGAGIPLLCQHTAGSDGRQWRFLLEDSAVTRHFRVIAHDLPYHGKSLPPAGIAWWTEEYRLTQDSFMAFVVSLARALELERPVYMGCSMGGHLAPDLALHHPEDFRAVIGLEAALESHGVERLLPYFHHPRIASDFKSGLMYSLMSPTSPETSKRETVWVYSQGAPAVFKGDLNYYAIEHDLTERAKEIDTRKIAVYILGGEYDWSATPPLCRRLADEIPGARYVEMKGLGHFPMSEDYAAFRKYLLPVLDEIRER